MLNGRLRCCACGVLLAWGLIQQSGQACRAAVPLIFDTDLESDVDDAGTVALLHALASKGEVQLLAMGVSVKHRWSASCLDALNTFYGHPDIPIGRLVGDGIDSGSKYAERIARTYPTDLKPGQAPDVTRVYRTALTAAKDGSVVLVSVGFLTNMQNLLRSQPDAISPLSGRQLVQRKVRTWVCMGGKFPQGREWNVHRDASAARYAFDRWPTSIIFSGFEIGVDIQTGAGLKRL
ncbi:MAG: nucleoside hydrolase, partial [Planctomycetaceae bacterium]